MTDSEDMLRLTLTLSPPGSNPQRAGAATEEEVAAAAVESSSSSTTATMTTTTASMLRRCRKASSGGVGGETMVGSTKEETIAPPYPWSTERRAVVRPLHWLLANGLGHIHGDASCKKCGRPQVVTLEVGPALCRIGAYFLDHKDSMRDRAPPHWSNPRLLDCPLCSHHDCLKPLTSNVKKRRINWLFLLLTECLGLCTLEQLKYFCKHTRRHRTGAKDRVLYLTYAGLLTQLDPLGPYDL